jgi:hypothetical protein
VEWAVVLRDVDAVFDNTDDAVFDDDDNDDGSGADGGSEGEEV